MTIGLSFPIKYSYPFISFQVVVFMNFKDKEAFGMKIAQNIYGLA